MVSLNVNGLRDHRKRRLLFDFLKYEKFDVIFLQETHIATVENCVKWNKESGLKGYWSLGLSNSCGVGILLCDPNRFKHCTFRCDAAGRIISLDCTFNSQDLRFINIYALTDGTKRIEFFQSLDTHFVSRRRLMIGGDFNCMLDLEKDKYGGNPASGDTGALHLKKLIQRFDLVDIWRKQHPTDRQFMWQTKRGSIKCHLDRFYFSSSLVRDYDVETDIMIYPYSDHDLVRVLLTVDKASSNVGPGVWKLNVSLLQVQEVR